MALLSAAAAAAGDDLVRRLLDELGLAVFALMLPLLNGLVLLGVGDTLARKCGLKVFGAGMHHDPLLSTRKKRSPTGATAGWCWV